MKRILSVLLVLLFIPMLSASALTTLEDLANQYNAVPIPELADIIGVIPEDKGELIVSDDLRGQGYTFLTDDGAAFVERFESLLNDTFSASNFVLRDLRGRLYTHQSGARVLVAPELIPGYVVLVLEDGYTYTPFTASGAAPTPVASDPGTTPAPGSNGTGDSPEGFLWWQSGTGDPAGTADPQGGAGRPAPTSGIEAPTQDGATMQLDGRLVVMPSEVTAQIDEIGRAHV